MDPESFAKLQHQVKENNEELNDFLRDLTHWEKDMKKKDKELSDPLSDSAKFPPVRNKTTKHRKKNKKTIIEKDNGSKPKIKRIPGADYSSWDKFDVDKALEEIDTKDNYHSVSHSSSDEPDTEDEMLEIERKKQEAILEKDKGNKYFKEGKYDEAISCYSLGMICDPSNALLPANRAMALLKKGSLAAAEKDCNLALSIDPTYVKAYLRRGAARVGLKKYDIAKDDFQKALEFDPSNKEAKLKIINIEKEIENNILQDNEKNKAENEKNICKSDFIPGPKGDNIESNKINKQNGIIMAVNKPPHQRSKKPLKRIEIQEVLSDSEDIVTKDETSTPSTNDNCQSSVDTRKKELLIEEKTSAKLTDTNKQSVVDSSSITDTAAFSENLVIHSIPQTAYQFYADWRALRRYSLNQYHYLKQLQPEQLPKLFKQSMDAEVFSDILMILKQHFLEEIKILYQYLKHLTQVGRFGTLTLFLSQEEQKTISMMMDAITSSNECTEEEVNLLRHSYGVNTH